MDSTGAGEEVVHPHSSLHLRLTGTASLVSSLDREGLIIH